MVQLSYWRPCKPYRSPGTGSWTHASGVMVSMLGHMLPFSFFSYTQGCPHLVGPADLLPSTATSEDVHVTRKGADVYPSVADTCCAEVSPACDCACCNELEPWMCLWDVHITLRRTVYQLPWDPPAWHPPHQGSNNPGKLPALSIFRAEILPLQKGNDTVSQPLTSVGTK